MGSEGIEVLRGRAVGAFVEAFGRLPVWLAMAPGRVNLIGEHTDYNQGFVLPMAIDRACVAAGGPGARPGWTRVVAADLGQCAEFECGRVMRPGEWRWPTGSWQSYVAGVVAQFRQLPAGREVPNLDIVLASSVPPGGGLSSSAAVEVAVATLLESAAGIEIEPREKALLCQRAEHEFAGVPCGIMDQMVSAMGRRGQALLIDCRSGEATAIPMPPGDRAAVMVINSGVRHALAGGEYAARRASCDGASAAMGLASLRDADLEMVESARGRLSEVEFRRAKHVVTENARTLGAAEALRLGDLERVGRLMRESHESLRADYEVSCAELDAIVESASAVRGVFGARMTGGGFGGCVVAMVETAAAPEVGRRVASDYQRRFAVEPTVFVTSAGGGARAVPVG